MRTCTYNNKALTFIQILVKKFGQIATEFLVAYRHRSMSLLNYVTPVSKETTCFHTCPTSWSYPTVLPKMALTVCANVRCSMTICVNTHHANDIIIITSSVDTVT